MLFRITYPPFYIKMFNGIVKTYTELFPPERKKIKRYAGIFGEVSRELEEKIECCLNECNDAFGFRLCATEFSIKNFFEVFSCAKNSADLQKNLLGCANVVVFVATIGLGIDKLISKYARISPTKALIFQAIGAERIEALCDHFCADLKAEIIQEGKSIRPRFSPGYGDFPLEVQRELLQKTGASKRIGVTLTESLLMVPTKSVTAVVGIIENEG